ncbi:MAG: type II secretion system secretin GspD [Rhodospirillaceae bacterium]|nr:type II secretion system secretin GspD [Rhodospirillaceae bacterium]
MKAFAPLLALLAWFATAPALAQQAAPPGQVLNLRDADIRAFITDVSMMTGRTFVVDPRVQGKVTVVSQTPLGADDLFELFLATLRVNGFAALPTSAGAYRIVPEEGASQDAAPSLKAANPDDQIVTEVITLRYTDVTTALQMIQPIVNAQGRAISNRGSNAVVVVDYAANVRRVKEVLAQIDRDPTIMQTIRLVNSAATDMARAITGLMQSEGQGDGAASHFSAMPMEGSNLLVVRARPEVMAKLVPVIAELDSRAATESDTRVIYLRHAAADEILPILERISASMVRGADGEGAGAARANIGVHAGTNALVINASQDVQRQLADVVKQLDIPRAQVLVEAIIVEVSDTVARQLGLQYVLAGGDGSNIPFTVTNFPNASPNVLAATGAVVLDRETQGEDTDAIKGLQSLAVDSLLGLQGLGAGFAGQASDGTIFGVILNALQSDTGSNVLSTPSIMTMDNQAASILVGQEIPITTGEALGSANTNPFRTIERKDVGIKLEVRPQINEGEAIKMFIRQEVSSVLGPVSTASSELITNKREVETTVMVKDGQIIVLGGLIEDDEQVSVDKVPVLGDIPLLGRAFRSEGKSKRRTNLMVFMRPTIVKTAEDMRAVTDRKYDSIRAKQGADATADSNLDRVMRELLGPGAIGTGAIEPRASAP